MSPQKQIVDVPFTGNIDQSIADKLLPHSHFETLENVISDKTARLIKRCGYTQLSKDISPSGTIGTCVRLIEHNGELLMADGRALYGFNTSIAGNKWTSKGTYIPMVSDVTPITTNITGPRRSIGYANGHVVIITQGLDTAGSPSDTVDVIELSTKNKTIANMALSSFGGGVSGSAGYYRTVSIDTPSHKKVFFVYHDQFNHSIKAILVDCLTPFATPTVVTLATDTLVSPAVVDVDAIIKGTDNFYVAYQDNTNLLRILVVGATGVVTSSANIGADDPTGEIALMTDDGATNYYCAYVASTGALRICGFTGSTPTQVFAPVSISAAPGTVDAIVGCAKDADEIYVYWEVYSGATADPHNNRIYSASVQNNGTITTAAAVFLRGLNIASKPFVFNGIAYFAVAYESPSGTTWAGRNQTAMQNTMFLVDETKKIVARTLVGQSYCLNHSTMSLSDVINVSTGKYAILGARFNNEVIFQTEAISANTKYYEAVMVDFDFYNHGNNISVDGNLLIQDGQLWLYDGEYVTEHGFQLYPQGLYGTAGTPGAGYALTDGTYQYKVAYAYTDENGKFYISAPSGAFSITLSAGGANQNVTLNIPTLRITSKQLVYIFVYRTTNGGSIFYNLQYQINDPTVDVITITEGLNDTTLAACPVLYTDGGALDHIAPPSGRYVCSHNNRIFIASEGAVYYSKEIIEDNGAQFCDALRVLIDKDGGEICSLASQDGNLIIFQEKRISRIYGEGPNDLGVGGYSNPILITSDIGATVNTPILPWAGGVLFKSPKGIWAIDRSLQTTYIGEKIQDYNSYSVNAMTLLKDDARIQLLIAGVGVVLCYDYTNGRWSVFTNHSGEDACVWQNKYCFASSTGQANKESTAYTDGSTEITAKIKTGWLTVGGILGFERVWWVYLYGEWLSAHTLNIKINYPDGTSETHTFTQTTTVTPYEVRIKPAKQKASRMQFEIWDSGMSGSKASLKLYGLSFHVGVKAKLPLPASKSA